MLYAYEMEYNKEVTGWHAEEEEVGSGGERISEGMRGKGGTGK